MLAVKVEEEIIKEGGIAFSKECNISQKIQCEELIRFLYRKIWKN